MKAIFHLSYSNETIHIQPNTLLVSTVNHYFLYLLLFYFQDSLYFNLLQKHIRNGD